MSRSYKQTPIGGITTCKSEKQAKKDWHGWYRTAVKQAIRKEKEILPHIREYSDPWNLGKDGKFWLPRFSGFSRKWLRK